MSESSRKTWVRIVTIILALLAVLVLAGPRPDLSVNVSPTRDIDPQEWVAKRASAFPDIIPGTEDRLIWAGEEGATTQRSIVYLHGFSGSAAMAYPFVDSLSAALGANAYIPRLAGHGRTPEALGQATMEEWVQQTVDAIAIGGLIGGEVLLVGMSTGGTLALWASAQPRIAEGLEALVLLSPNVAPADPRADMLLWPWGGALATAVSGRTHEWEPFSEAHARFTTNRYPTRALVQMMATVGLLRREDPAAIRAPVLALVSGGDRVVSVRATQALLARLPGPAQLVDLGPVGDPNRHVIVGDALSPESTMPAVRAVVEFLHSTQH